MTDISVIITAHREGLLAGPSAHSARRAIERAQAERGLAIEVILVFDSASRDTREILENGLSGLENAPIRIREVELGDPGLARNAGIEDANGTTATFLDGDDLWASNWLSAAYAFYETRPDAVLHSACNITFGQHQLLWWHVDSEGPLFDRHYLNWANYWDAMSFAGSDIYRQFPFIKNDLKLGFGHEDWHWGVVTFEAGVAHKPVPETIHFKRRRAGSQMSLVEQANAIMRPTRVKPTLEKVL